MPLRAVQPPVTLTEELVRTHQRGLWRFLRFLGAEPALADDLTQEAFLRLIDNPPEDRGPAATAAWLRTTGRRLFFKSGRRARVGLETVPAELLEDAWLKLAGRQPSSSGDEYLDALNDCVGGLESRHRRAIELRYHDGASRQDMAVALSISEAGVKTMLRRLREILGECVEKKTGGER